MGQKLSMCGLGQIQLSQVGAETWEAGLQWHLLFAPGVVWVEVRGLQQPGVMNSASSHFSARSAVKKVLWTRLPSPAVQTPEEVGDKHSVFLGEETLEHWARQQRTGGGRGDRRGSHAFGLSGNRRKKRHKQAKESSSVFMRKEQKCPSCTLMSSREGFLLTPLGIEYREVSSGDSPGQGGRSE